MLAIRVARLLEGFPVSECSTLVVGSLGRLCQSIAPKLRHGIITLESERRWRTPNIAEYLPYPSTNDQAQNGEDTSD